MTDEHLEHFGVKGMKWGQRKAAFQRNRQLNKASRQKDAADWQRKVERARGRVASGATDRAYDAVRSQHKQNKKELGSREARKILNKAREKRMDEINLANEHKNNAEFVTSLVTDLGKLVVANL